MASNMIRFARHNYGIALLVLVAAHVFQGVQGAFVPAATRECQPSSRPRKQSNFNFHGSTSSREGSVEALKAPEQKQDRAVKSVTQLKNELLTLLSSMKGSNDEFRQVESLVNALEAVYQPVQTLDFFNMAIAGEWQLLFSTNLRTAAPQPNTFRLRELIQRVECQGREGSLVNAATWDLAEQGDARFCATGTFSIQCTYRITQGSRRIIEVQDHVLEPARGSNIPENVPALVGLLHRSIPRELFDPSDHAIDVTYLDANVKIVRYTGSQLEGVRDIFIRKE